MKEHYDVIVIGGGIIGLSCGYYLSKSGRKVLVLDQSEFAAGSSGACDDMILLQSKKAGVTLELSIESLELYRSLEGELGYDFGFKQLGGMILIENQRDLSIMEEFVQGQRAYGVNVSIIDRKETMQRQPNINPKYIASTYSADDSQVYPMLVMKGFTEVGKKLGMEIKYRDGLADIERVGNNTWKVKTDSGNEIKADNIVIASGAWSGKVGEIFGIDIPISPKKGQLLITEKIPPVGETNLWTADYMVTKLRPELKIESELDSTLSSLGLGFSFTRTSHGNYLIGSTREDVGFDKRATYQALNALGSQVGDIVPLMKNVHIIRHIAGFRPAVSDGKMILGSWPGMDGLFIAAGHEGDGIALAPITGKLLSDYVCGRKVPDKIKELSPERFFNGTK